MKRLVVAVALAVALIVPATTEAHSPNWRSICHGPNIHFRGICSQPRTIEQMRRL